MDLIEITLFFLFNQLIVIFADSLAIDYLATLMKAKNRLLLTSFTP